MQQGQALCEGKVLPGGGVGGAAEGKRCLKESCYLVVVQEVLQGQALPGGVMLPGGCEGGAAAAGAGAGAA